MARHSPGLRRALAWVLRGAAATRARRGALTSRYDCQRRPCGAGYGPPAVGGSAAAERGDFHPPACCNSATLAPGRPCRCPLEGLRIDPGTLPLFFQRALDRCFAGVSPLGRRRKNSQRVELSDVDPRLLQYAAQRARCDLAVVRHYRCTGNTAFCLGELDVASLLSDLRESRCAQFAHHVTVRIRLHLRWRWCSDRVLEVQLQCLAEIRDRFRARFALTCHLHPSRPGDEPLAVTPDIHFGLTLGYLRRSPARGVNCGSSLHLRFLPSSPAARRSLTD